MPVETADLATATTDYRLALESRSGVPLQFDLVQLGLGADGHTASLFPGDPLLQTCDRDVALTSDPQGLHRMTLTLPAINRARRRLWLVTGESKTARLGELLAGTGNAPATAVNRANALVVADECAAGADLRSGPYPG
jgi:6-phosphogluconolactonase